MTLCSQCGSSISGETSLCTFHHLAISDTWAATNKIWNDYFHRGVEIPRLYPEPLTEPAWETYSYYTSVTTEQC